MSTTSKRVLTNALVWAILLFTSLMNLAAYTDQEVRDAVLPDAGYWSYETDNTTIDIGSDIPPGGDLYVSSSLQKIVPTNRWWSSLYWDLDKYWDAAGDPEIKYSLPIYVDPYVAMAAPEGLTVFYEPKVNTEWELAYEHMFYFRDDASGNRDLSLGVETGGTFASFDDTKVGDFSDWSVTAQWDNGSASMETTLVKGVPYIYVKVNGGNARIDIRTFDSDVDYPQDFEVFYHDENVIAFTRSGWTDYYNYPTAESTKKYYALFAPTGATWNIINDQPCPIWSTQTVHSVTSDLNGKGYYILAVLPDKTTATLDYFKQHAYAFITDTKVSWNYDEDNSLVTTTFDVTTELQETGQGYSSAPLMLLYPHQWKNSTATLTDYSYLGPKGITKLFEGNTFQTQLRYHGVLPVLPKPDGVDTQLMTYINNRETQSIAKYAKPFNYRITTYDGGKDIAKISALLPILSQLEMEDELEEMIISLESELESWFSASGSMPFFNYHSKFNSIVGYPAAFNSDRELNDHHFHWGYFLRTAAMLELYDPNWASDSKWGGMVKMLIRDATSPLRDDPMFPFLRTFDVYSGHSWASGHSNLDKGNNQESTSESISYSTGLIQYGEATGNKVIRETFFPP